MNLMFQKVQKDVEDFVIQIQIGWKCLESLTLLNLIRPPTKGIPSSIGGALPWKVWLSKRITSAARNTTPVATAMSCGRGRAWRPSDRATMSKGIAEEIGSKRREYNYAGTKGITYNSRTSTAAPPSTQSKRCPCLPPTARCTQGRFG